MTVDLCFDGRVPASLDAQTPASRDSLLRAEGLRGDRAWPLERAADGIDLTTLAPGDCARHVLDLAATVRRADTRGVRREGADLLLSSDHWLWEPSGSNPDVRLVASFELPDGIDVALPWPRTESGAARFRIPPSAFAWRALGALGRFSTTTTPIDGRELRIAILGSGWKISSERLRGWIEDAARAVAGLYGEFPAREALVLVLPVAGDQVVFGYALSGGGASVALLVGRGCDSAALRADWLAVHELLHVGWPVMDADAAWLYEGVATYYEPVLRARAGWITPRDAWEQLHDGFLRGSSRGSGRTLRTESADMAETRQYWRVYWAGAAIALISDVAIRTERSGRSLDDDMRAVPACCSGEPRRWSADELLDQLAKRERGNRLAATARRYLDTATFPDYQWAYRALGLRFDSKGRVATTDDPDARALRVAIMGADVEQVSASGETARPRR